MPESGQLRQVLDSVRLPLMRQLNLVQLRLARQVEAAMLPAEAEELSELPRLQRKQSGCWQYPCNLNWCRAAWCHRSVPCAQTEWKSRCATRPLLPQKQQAGPAPAQHKSLLAVKIASLARQLFSPI